MSLALAIAPPSLARAQTAEIAPTPAPAVATGDTAATDETSRTDGAARGGIEGFEPNYLLVGADALGGEGVSGEDCDVKFQLSFARRLTVPSGMREGRLGRAFGRDSPLFFGFTQRAWWDICRDSSPFRETNYAPSLFYRGTVAAGGGTLDVLAGYVHESNGEGGEEGERSTSWDRLFLRARLPFGRRLGGLGFDTTDRRRWLLDLTLWYPFATGEENEDITRFAGYGELVLTWTPTPDTRLRLTARKGGAANRFDRGLGELDLLFPLPGTEVHGMLQYTNGYGASLGRFDRHEYALRVGVVFSDVTLP